MHEEHEDIPATTMDRQLSILNSSPKLLEGPSLLHELIAGPDQPGTAIDHLDPQGNRTPISYCQLHHESDKLAVRLLRLIKDHPSGRPGIIPLYIAQSPSLYISQLATLKAGAAFCPLSLDIPEDRLRFILQDVSARAIITTSDLQEKLCSMQGLRVLVVDEDGDETDGNL